jgi:hypothetical protein
MRNWNSCVRSSGESRRYPWYDLERNFGIVTRLRFLAASPEYEGIPTFQSNHPLSRAGETNEQGIDVVLGGGPAPRTTLSDMVQFGAPRRFRKRCD